jgi:hypothetical protein
MQHANANDVKIGLSNADGVYTVWVDDIAVVELLKGISAMTRNNELEYWGGIVTDLNNCNYYNADSDDSPYVRITRKEAQGVYDELLAALPEDGEFADAAAEAAYEDKFLELWQGMGLA